jgi:hypothetical protein
MCPVEGPENGGQCLGSRAMASDQAHRYPQPMPRLLRSIGAAAVSLIVLVALSGCLKLDMDLKINSDDTVSGSIVMAFSKDFITQTGSSTDEFTDQLLTNDDVTKDLPKGGRVEKYVDDKYAGIKMIFDKVALSEFNDSGSDGSDSTSEDSLKITHTAGKFHVDGVMDLTSDETSTDNPFAGLASEMAASFKVRVAITFPGKVSEHTGKLSGNTVVWEPKFGEKTTIHAIGEDSGGSAVPVAMIAGVGGGVLLIALALLFFLLMRRRKPAPVTAVPGAGAMPGYGYPDPYAAPPPQTYAPPAPPYTQEPPPPHQ